MIDDVRHELIGKAPEQIVDLGIALVPEGRRLFPRLTVEENLLLGAYRPAARTRISENMAEQNFNQAIRIADRGYVIVHGRIEYEGASREELRNNELIHKLYMGL